LDQVPPIEPPFEEIPPLNLPNSETCISLTAQARSTYQRLIPTLASLEQRKRFLVKLQGILDSEFPDKRIKAHLFGCAMFVVHLRVKM
jgi:DNA polymerase sigma